MNEFSFMRNSLTLMVTSLVIVFLLTISFIVVEDTNRYKLQQEGSVLQAQTTPVLTATLTCAPTALTLTITEQRVTATFRNAQGQAVKGRKILWRSSLSDNRINILNPSSDTDAQGVVGTRVKARDKKFEGSVGTITAVVDNNRDIRCAISLVAQSGVTEPPGTTEIPSITVSPNPDLTETVSPSPTDNGNLGKKEARLAFTIFLHGIGRGGDNLGPNAAGNQNPRSTTIPIVIDVLRNANLKIEKKVTVDATYDPVIGGFKVTRDFKDLPEGNYRFRVKAKKFLESIPIQAENVKHDIRTNVPAIYLEAGDINDDSHRNILDWSILIGCYSDFAPPDDCDEQRKIQADLTNDLQVNAEDLSLYLREIADEARPQIE